MDTEKKDPVIDKYRVEKMLAEYERAQEIGLHAQFPTIRATRY